MRLFWLSMVAFALGACARRLQNELLHGCHKTESFGPYRLCGWAWLPRGIVVSAVVLFMILSGSLAAAALIGIWIAFLAAKLPLPRLPAS
jgi:hypothetical protein